MKIAIMIIIFIETTITYFLLKFKIYIRIVPVMTTNTLTLTSVFQHQSCRILTFIIHTNNSIKKRLDSIFCLHEKQT